MMSKSLTDFSENGGASGIFRSGSVLLAALLAIAGCEKPTAQKNPPPPPVTVANPIKRDVIEWDTYTGHLEAPQAVNVAARVSGLIMETPFVEGALVKKGDVLVVIDDRPFKADLDSKLADQQRMEAQQAIAKLTYDRVAGLGKDRAVSQQDIDNAKSSIDQANAAVASAKAAVEIARLNLEWCKVVSPIDGRVSNKMVTVGNLVNGGAGQATLLTTIESVNPIYCYVDVDEHSVLKYQKLAAEGKRVSARDGKVACYLQLGNETGYPHQGHVDFVDNHLDPTTGTQRARGVFENTSGSLTPGFFAKLCVPGSGKYSTLLVPDNAIGNDQDQRTVLVVDKDHKVVPTQVKLGAQFGKLRSVVSGLSEDDLVIINGQMHARPGSVVDPNIATIPVDPAIFTDPSAVEAATAPSTGETPPPTNAHPASKPARTGNGQ